MVCSVDPYNKITQLKKSFSSECDMEVWNFQIESLASSELDAPRSSSDDANEDSNELENRKLREVEFLDILHFKRVIRRPLSDIRVLPKQPNPSIITQISENSDVRRKYSLPNEFESEQLYGKDLPQLSAPQPMRVLNGNLVDNRFRTNIPKFSIPNAGMKGTNGASAEIFKSFRVSMDDPTSKVLPAALHKYNINAPPSDYALYIVYGDKEHPMGLAEKPLRLFKQLEKEGLKAMFMLRKLASRPPTKSEVDEHDDTSRLSYINSEELPSISRVKSSLPQSRGETFEKPISPPSLPARLLRSQRSSNRTHRTEAEILRPRIYETDSCATIISMALESQGINKPWLFYNLFISYEDQESLVASEEEPMHLFRKLVLEGYNPVFLLRNKYAHDEKMSFTFVPDMVRAWEAIRNFHNTFD